MGFKAHSVQELADFLEERGVSDDSTQRLVANKIYGQALMLLDSEELKELLPLIGGERSI